MAIQEKENFQKLYMQHEMLKQHITAYAEQSSLIEAKIAEIINTMEAVKTLGDMKTESEIWTNLGSQVFVKSDVKQTEKILVEIGAGVYGKKPVEESLKILEDRKNEMIDVYNKIAMEINRMGMQMQHIEPEMKRLAEKLQE